MTEEKNLCWEKHIVSVQYCPQSQVTTGPCVLEGPVLALYPCFSPWGDEVQGTKGCVHPKDQACFQGLHSPFPKFHLPEEWRRVGLTIFRKCRQSLGKRLVYPLCATKDCQTAGQS